MTSTATTDEAQTSAEDTSYMRACIELARLAAAQDEVPVGALVVHHHPETGARRVIGTGFNIRETAHDPTGHAELIAIRRAGLALGQWRLNECTLYVTLEPCPMCSGAAYWTRIGRIVYGARDDKRGGLDFHGKRDEGLLHPKTELVGGVHEEECAELLTSFFRSKRKN